ncbi:glutamate receptor ionotropic, kainate 2-like isoform X1 [Cydia pomonella]|uniref:glutamate receptor ionotropic, kainate 2-like isoform X1 n=1 Tax=Cydia pomonella TaxID=82600 RepID=UPI002ADE5618|nr:glutamate receptor ionotropic, kainate 2-like isoform X1 [Cydia pomonella]
MDRYKLLFILALVLQICQIKAITSARSQFPIWGLFTRLSDDKTVEVFRKFANDSRRSYFGKEKISRSPDSFTVSLEMCDEGFRSSAIVDGRPTRGICDNVCLRSNKLQIPHLTLDWEPAVSAPKEGFTISYYPPPEVISKVYATYIKKKDWDRFSFMYEDEGSFIRLQEVINTWENDKKPILFKKIYPEGDNRETFKHVFKVARLSYHIIDCKADNIKKYLEEITKVVNYTAYQNILLTSLDAYTVDLTSINIEGNVTTWHLTMEQKDKWTDNRIDNPKKIETYLAADALSHLEKSIKYMLDNIPHSSYNIPQPPPLCYDGQTQPWEMGPNLRDALLSTNTAISQGFTGNVEFDDKGKRVNFILHYSKLNNESQFVYVGNWNSTTDKIEEINLNNVQDVRSNVTFRVVTRKEAPYYMVPKNGDPPKGYVIDLMDEIFKHIREKEHPGWFHVVDDPGLKVGGPIEGSRRWSGLIGEILEHKAHFAVSDLTITSERNAVVDFSIPFMSLGISMLFKVDPPPDPDMFSFVNPLSTDVWLYLAVVYIITSLVLLICARMSQEDWVNPHPCDRNPKELQNIWSLYNCMWLTMGSIMTQGCDILPRGAGSRWIAGTWWFFAMIVTASYTANMSTFMSNNRRSNNIENAKDLSEQTAVSYGAMLNGSTHKFFQSSNDPIYQKLYQGMSTANPTAFTANNDEGMERVLRSKGKFVFFMESTTIEYFMQQDCRLKMVGGKLDSKDYGIAMPKNSPHRMAVNNAILYLQEKGKLQDLKNKWWVKDPDSPDIDECKNEDSSGKKEKEDSGSVQMKNTSGIFLVLGVGGILGFIVAIIGFFLHSHEIAVKEGISYKEALASEWRVSLDPRVLSKPAAPPRSAAPSIKSTSPSRERSRSRAASVLSFAQSFINLNEVY